MAAHLPHYTALTRGAVSQVVTRVVCDCAGASVLLGSGLPGGPSTPSHGTAKAPRTNGLTRTLETRRQRAQALLNADGATM